MNLSIHVVFLSKKEKEIDLSFSMVDMYFLNAGVVSVLLASLNGFIKETKSFNSPGQSKISAGGK